MGNSIWLVSAIVLWTLVFLVVRWSRRQDYLNGRRAYEDGLTLNHAWGKHAVRGYRDAQREDPYRGIHHNVHG